MTDGPFAFGFREILEQIAAEIEAKQNNDPNDDDYNKGVEDAAAIVREHSQRWPLQLVGVRGPTGIKMTAGAQTLPPVAQSATITTAVANAVDHPPHYTQHPSGIECIQITEHMGFCLGNAVKYIWRADLKQNALEDLKKARWYLDREIAKREVEAAPKS